MTGSLVCIMDLAEYLQAEVDRTSIRKVAKKAGLASKGPIERIINHQNEGFPEIETLVGIAKGFGLELLEVMRMAGATIPEPKTPAEARQRLGGLVTQVPSLDRVVEDLRDMYVHDPAFVSGMIVGLEMSIDQWKRQRKSGEEPDQQGGQ
jgi:transcriptional regulator with XRE-family HTH domain